MNQPPDKPATEAPVIVARPVVRYARGLRRPRPLELLGVSRGAAMLDVLLILFVAVLTPISLEVLAFVLSPQTAAGVRFDWTLVARKWIEALLLVALLVLLVHRHRLSAAAFGCRTRRLGGQLAWSLPALFGGYVVMLTIGVLLMSLSGAEKDVAQRVEFLDRLPLDNLWITVLLLIAVAVHEELLFRALLIPLLRRIGLGWIGALLLSTALFAVLHVAQGWMAIAQVFGLGLVFGIVFVLSRSTLAVIIAHFAFDLIQFQVARLLLPWLQRYSEST